MLDSVSKGKKQYRRGSRWIFWFVFPLVGIGPLLLLVLAVAVIPANAWWKLGTFLALTGTIMVLVHWIRCFRRWQDCIEVDDLGISSISKSTRQTIGWNEIAEIRTRQSLPDAYLNISPAGGGSSLQVYYALKGFEELALEIANRTQGRSQSQVVNGYFGPEKPNRPVFRCFVSAFVLVTAGLAAGAAGFVNLQWVCVVIAGLVILIATCRTFFANTRTIISQEGVRVETALRSRFWPISDIEDVTIGLTPGSVNHLDLRIQFVGGRRKEVMVQGADPIALFNSLRAATGSTGSIAGHGSRSS